MIFYQPLRNTNVREVYLRDKKGYVERKQEYLKEEEGIYSEINMIKEIYKGDTYDCIELMIYNPDGREIPMEIPLDDKGFMIWSNIIL